MFEDQSGWMWLLINVVAVVILAAAIIYGTMHWRKRRSRALNQARDNATDRLYHKQPPTGCITSNSAGPRITRSVN